MDLPYWHPRRLEQGLGGSTAREVRVPFDARAWSALDRRFREGFIAGVGATAGDARWRVLGHGGVLLEELAP